MHGGAPLRLPGRRGRRTDVASCERCWGDAFLRSLEGPDDQATAYRKLIAERTGDRACTPEQQAGEDALWCPECGRRTWHQAAKLCTLDPRHGQHGSPSSEEPTP